MNIEEACECPLCMEPLELDDFNFYPCTCGYQICRFCWHRIRTDENGLCPACRKAYPEDPAEFKPLTEDELQRIKKERRQKDMQRKQKAAENRKHLANVRVVQKNLVFVVGLSQRLADPEVLKKHEYFGKFGKTMKVVINQSTSYAGAQVGGPSASAYITYLKSEDALRAIQVVNNYNVDGRNLKASLGTTKYCSHFLRGTQCPKPDCMYLHELGEEAASFTKEEMQQSKHQEYEQSLYEAFMNSQNLANTVGGGGNHPPPSQTPPTVLHNNTQPKNHQAHRHSPVSGASSASNTPPPPPSLLSSTLHNHDVASSSSNSAWPSLQPASKPLTNGTAASASSSSNNKCDHRPDTADSPASSVASSASSAAGTTAPPPPQQPPPSTEHMSRAPGHNRDRQQQQQQQTDNRNNHIHSPLSSPLPNGSSSIPADLPQQQQQPPTSIAPPNGNSNTQQAPPPGLLPPGIPPLINPQYLKSRPYSMDSTADSMSLFSMSGGYSTGNRHLAVAAAAAAAAAEASKQNSMPQTEGILDSIPPVCSTTDWQEAFGFGGPRDRRAYHHQPEEQQQQDPAGALHADDELDFDPWMESQKELAKLVEMEGNQRQQQQQQQQQTSMASSSPQIKNLPPGFTSNHIGAAFPPQPPNNNPYMSVGNQAPPHIHQQLHNHHQHHHQHHQHPQHQQQQFSQQPKADNNIAPHMQNGGSDVFDLQESLRSLLPNIKISFGPSHNQIQQQHNPQQQNNVRRNMGNSWDPSYDPAIVDSHVEAGAGESEPHWMASLHSLTEEQPPSSSSLSSNHNRLPFTQHFQSVSASGAASSPWSAAPPPPGFHQPQASSSLPHLQLMRGAAASGGNNTADSMHSNMQPNAL